MLILLPPSEGKTAPDDGAAVDLDALSFPELTGDRVDLLAALVRLCRTSPEAAAQALGLGPTQAADVERNAVLPQAPAAPAREVYSGVLYDALGLRTLRGGTALRADESVLITSGLWGLLRPSDIIPAYRLGGGVSLPGVGPLAAFWRRPLSKTLPAAAGDELIIDLRSSTYAGFWRPPADLAARTVVVRVLHEHDGRRTVVSHHNKATKGRIVRRLLQDGARVTTPARLVKVLTRLGWTAELTPPSGPGRPATVDVVVTEVPTS
ncbi:peroxide stress protein YaaA [Jiangella rhizosphaerae]|uniref:Peroxide stress protein YaaA n=1 Tax=Jiangella rhizosphaerae TaxID=2293569 RepID=A0A418KHE9_9ACTN|nr:peroxide stress protein YaaA [Jiangella rhizosphaerae]RIQ11396.1 peroxide stress protein YaaA [Jiangella rhizosphaerae]